MLFCRRYLDPAKARRLGRRRLSVLMHKRALDKFDEVRADRLWQVIENAPELNLCYDSGLCARLKSSAGTDRQPAASSAG